MCFKMCTIKNWHLWFCFRLLFKKCSPTIHGFFFYDYSVLYVCMGEISSLWLTLKEQTVLSTDWQEFIFTKKKSQITFFVVSFFFIMLRNHGQLCSFGRWQNVNVPHWNLCFFTWQPGLVAICHRPYNVFLICSIKELYPAFCRMWTCCERKYTKRLTEREPWRSLQDHCFLNWNVWGDLGVQFQSHAVQLHFQTDM